MPTASYTVSDAQAGPEASTYGCDSSAGRNVSTTNPASAPHPGHLPSITLTRPTLRPHTPAFITPKNHSRAARPILRVVGGTARRD